MVKVITYGTFDLLHYGHIRLLERARALGDYLIVGVTSDDYDLSRGKINVKQSLIERIEAVRATGLADEIIVEEYAGQKIDDVRRLGVDIFTVGSDWVGTFDYLGKYCKVVYLPRTEGVSSTQLRAKDRFLRLGLVGDVPFVNKFYRECGFVNGVEVVGVCAEDLSELSEEVRALPVVTGELSRLLEACDAVYITTAPADHCDQIRQALSAGKHVLCEAPITADPALLEELEDLAAEKGLVLETALRTAYSMAYDRLLLLVGTGIIGAVRSVDATCTTIRPIDLSDEDKRRRAWNSICDWGPTALLPVFQILGTEPVKKTILTVLEDEESRYDSYTRVDLIYEGATASVKVGKGVKSESDLVITGETGCIYVPAPWWKTDYFEVRFEDPARNRRFFYQLDGEGIRYEVVNFLKAVETGRSGKYVSAEIAMATARLLKDFYDGTDVVRLKK